MAPLAGLREELYQEMLSHIKQTDVSVPYRDGAWWYYTRTEEGLQYGIHCRKRGTAGGTGRRCGGRSAAGRQSARQGPRVFCDRRHRHYATMAAGWPTPPTRRAFASTRCASKTLRPAKPLPGEVERVGSVVWAADNRTLFYTVEDEQQKRQFQLWRHVLGAPHTEDVLVYQDDDERFNLAAGRTRDGKYIVLESASHTTSESAVLRRGRPGRQLSLISRRARTSTNTRSTIATGSGLSAPTIAGATSGW